MLGLRKERARVDKMGWVARDVSWRKRIETRWATYEGTWQPGEEVDACEEIIRMILNLFLIIFGCQWTITGTITI